MTMSGAGLTAALKPVIKSEIESAFEILNAAQLDTLAQALANAIGSIVVSYVTANAVVTSTVIVTSVSGVSTGPGVSGPGLGTASGTIT